MFPKELTCTALNFSGHSSIMPTRQFSVLERKMTKRSSALQISEATASEHVPESQHVPSFCGWEGRPSVPGAWAFPGSPHYHKPFDMVHPAPVYPYPWLSGLLTLFCSHLLSFLLPLSLPLAFVRLRKWKAHTGIVWPPLIEVLSLISL